MKTKSVDVISKILSFNNVYLISYFFADSLFDGFEAKRVWLLLKVATSTHQCLDSISTWKDEESCHSAYRIAIDTYVVAYHCLETIASIITSTHY